MSYLPPVKAEKQGFRDKWMSTRHRLFGWNCCMLDIDCMVLAEGECVDEFKGLEFDNAEPVALIEYKHVNEQFKLNHASIRAQSKLATKACLPSFVVVYWPEEVGYYVVATNQIAQELLNKLPGFETPRWWSEVAFVGLLYWIRGRKLPEEVKQNLETKTVDQKIIPMSLQGNNT